MKQERKKSFAGRKKGKCKDPGIGELRHFPETERSPV